MLPDEFYEKLSNHHHTPVQSNNPTSSTSNSVNENVIHNSLQNHPIINFNNCTVNFGVGSSSVMATKRRRVIISSDESSQEQ